MAPEQATGDTIDCRTDVYSWGIVTYEMTAGRHPFSATTPQKLVVAHLTEQPARLSHIAGDTPGWFCQLVMRCLEKDPERRPTDGAALVHAVEYGCARPSVGDSVRESLHRLFGGNASS